MEYTVTIDCNNYTVNPDDRPVQEGDGVAWATFPVGTSFTVDFKGGPFKEGDHFDNKSSRGSVRTGADKIPHKYTVRINGHVIDPRIIVN